MDPRPIVGFRTPDPLAAHRPFRGPPLPDAPPLPPPREDLLHAIREGRPCSYCPTDRKRPAYRALAASELLQDGSTRIVVRFVCAACDILVLDEVLGAPGAPSMRARVDELERLVEQLHGELRDARRASP